MSVKNNYDIVIAAVPKLDLKAPIICLAQLKSVIEKAGFSCKTLDWNIDLFHKVDLSKYLNIWELSDLTFQNRDDFEKFWHEVLYRIAIKWVEQIKSYDPRWLGLSLYSQRSYYLAEKLLKLARRKLPYVKLVIGGPYTQKFIELKEKNLIDVYVTGEGEIPIVSVLKNEFNGPGINGILPEQIGDLSSISIPDYSDFDFNLYPSRVAMFNFEESDFNRLGLTTLYITGSRGCINRCTFCDVCKIWPKYRYKTGEYIAEEMKYQFKKHKVKRFIFTDNLINGSMNEFRNFMKILTRYYRQKQLPHFKWTGQFVCRPKTQVSAEDYILIKRAGGYLLNIGIESGSEKVRRDMHKRFTNADIDFTFKQCAKNKIQMEWNMMVGYPTESEEDFQKSLDILTRYSYLTKMGFVHYVVLSPACEIIDGTSLQQQIGELGVYYDDFGNWVCEGMENTMENRIMRWFKLKKHCEKLGYPIAERNSKFYQQELKRIKRK